MSAAPELRPSQTMEGTASSAGPGVASSLEVATSVLLALERVRYQFQAFPGSWFKLGLFPSVWAFLSALFRGSQWFLNTSIQTVGHPKGTPTSVAPEDLIDFREFDRDSTLSQVFK